MRQIGNDMCTQVKNTERHTIRPTHQSTGGHAPKQSVNGGRSKERCATKAVLWRGQNRAGRLKPLMPLIDPPGRKQQPRAAHAPASHHIKAQTGKTHADMRHEDGEPGTGIPNTTETDRQRATLPALRKQRVQQKDKRNGRVTRRSQVKKGWTKSDVTNSPKRLSKLRKTKAENIHGTSRQIEGRRGTHMRNIAQHSWSNARKTHTVSHHTTPHTSTYKGPHDCNVRGASVHRMRR